MTRAFKVARILTLLVAGAFALACPQSSTQPAPAPAPAPAPVPPPAPVAPVAPPPVAPVAAPGYPQPVAPPAMPGVPVAPQPAALVPGAPAGDFIGVNMSARQAQYATGMIPVTQLLRGNLTQSSTQDFQAVLSPGRCYKIIGVGGPTVTDLDLILFDPNGVQLQQDVATDNYPVLGLSQPLCPTIAGAYRVQARMYAGNGEFGLQVFSTP